MKNVNLAIYFIGIGAGIVIWISTSFASKEFVTLKNLPIHEKIDSLKEETKKTREAVEKISDYLLNNKK